ncbi:MAG: site-2 protease family protein [Firmicutes bacterium]|uniref:Zn-dependent protease (Includes SpoIVFB) n=1 Tax=Melghirimyces thermohalophilus TaxID=1236220 RepID=A0A1G6PAV2_9BACL|nr:site-2 protease family protein [Melghirimyces thermohalophilus]MDA8351797.1 site-2 protease family protein [Bacillota bacterium]SDC77138.1 Zn-dependent protease (includes SpoIVFB) [Melghirimyces thermohalophilus]
MGLQEKQPRKNPFKRIGAWVAILLSGLKFIPSLLKLGKFGGTLISMVVTVGAYALLFPWSFAIGLVIMIFIHEMGHVLAAKQKGLPVSAPAFIPFLGALIMLKRQPQNAETEAYVAFGGPLLGTVGAMAAYLLAIWTGYEVLYPIAFIGFFLNLFNLLPIHPLDGGRIVTAISRWLWVVGLILGLVMILVLWSPLLLLVWILFAFQLWESFLSRRRSDEQPVKVTVDLDPLRFESMGMTVPGEKHRRELPFTQYCTLSDREHRCDVFLPPIGLIHRFEGFKGAFRRIQLVGTERVETETGDVIRMKLVSTYVQGAEEKMLRTDREYYKVSSRTRLGYSLVYFGLAAFLGYMVFSGAPVPLMNQQVVS